eukprot:TRINITY_DN1607_c0_g2_i1.p1 TRINITY_DN1607_c0_g2~~TRINITY_DN1607_c0_g2_i1.p1  ORF type:complete len:667 (-),score=145.21 TRINITY_DN1607_c0_g2_i1:2446-4446(-)
MCIRDSLEVIAFGIYVLVDSASRTIEDDYLYLRIGIFIVALAFWIFIMISKSFVFWYREILYPAIAFLVAFKVFIDFYLNYDMSFSAVLLAVFTCSNFRVRAFWITILNLVYLILFLIQTTIYYARLPNNFFGADRAQFYVVASYYVQVIALYGYINYKNWVYERDTRTNFLAKTQLQQSTKTSNDFLSILVPKFVKDILEAGKRHLSEDSGEVVILFCYICEFDKILSNVGEPIIEILDNLFRTFDSFCSNHGIQKIETVGYTYLVCAGLKSCEAGIPPHILAKDPTERMVAMAIEMVDYIKKRKIGGISLKMKVGIHRGPVNSGVIGHHKPQFSLIGDTVNTTSRICATTEEGKIAISEQVYKNLNIKNYRLTPKQVMMKGKGLTQTYILDKQRNQLREKLSNALKKERFAELTTKQVNALRKLATNQDMIKQKLGNIIQAGKKPTKDLSDEKPEVMSNELNMIKDDDDDEHMELDKKVMERFSTILLKPDLWCLTLVNNDRSNVENFYTIQSRYHSHKYFIMLVILFFVHLLQTVLIVSVRTIFKMNNLIIGVRFIFNFLLFAAVTSRHLAYKSILMRMGTLLVYLLGVASVLLETGLMRTDTIERQLLGQELMNGLFKVDVLQVVLIMTFGFSQMESSSSKQSYSSSLPLQSGSWLSHRMTR